MKSIRELVHLSSKSDHSSSASSQRTRVIWVLANIVIAAASLRSPSRSDATQYYWDGDGTGVVNGGSGTWDTTLARWSTTAGGSSYIVWPNGNPNADEAIFQNVAGTVTVGSAINVNKISLVTTNYILSGTNTITFSGTAPTVTSGVGFGALISAPLAGPVTFAGTPVTLYLTGNNSGLTAVTVSSGNAAGLIAANANALGGSSSTVLVSSGSQLNMGIRSADNSAPFSGMPTGGHSFNAGATTLAGGVLRARQGANTWNGNITLTANSSLATRAAADDGLNQSLTLAGTLALGANTLTYLDGNVASNTFVSINGNVSGTSASLITMTVPSLLNLGGNNSLWLGTLNLDNGEAKLTTSTSLSASNAVTFGSNANTKTLTLNGNSVSVSGLSTGGTVGTTSVQNNLAGTATLTIDKAAGSSTYGGTLKNGAAGTLALTKNGAGTQILSAANTYTGITTINGGVLALSGSGTISSSLDLNSGTLDIVSNLSLASLIGVGSITTSSDTVTVTSNFSPGHSAGAIGVTGGFTLAGTTTSTIEVNLTSDAFDELNVTGVMAYGGILNVVFSGADPLGGSYDVFDFGSFSGSFSSVNFSGLVGQTATFTPGTGVVSVSAVPEPSTFAMLLFGVLGLWLMRRNRT